MSKKEKPMHSLIAGTTAGAVEAFITYPTEFVKTRSQFSGKKQSPIAIIRETVQTKGLTGLYSGCMALVIGNAVKAGVRFVSYDHFKHALADAEGKVSPPRSLLAGLGAGMMEAVFAVTPSETIKTKLIDDSKSPNPRFRGLVHGTTVIVREEGLRGIYRGLFPVMMRQGANSAVRFTTYTTLKQMVQGQARPGQPISSATTFGIGAIAGLVTVYTTMPLDVIKTRMQSLEARQAYRNSFHCAYRIFTEEGLFRFWTGTTPRLARLVLSGGIVFTVLCTACFDLAASWPYVVRGTILVGLSAPMNWFVIQHSLMMRFPGYRFPGQHIGQLASSIELALQEERLRPRRRETLCRR